MANQFQPLVDSMETGLKDIVGHLIDGTVKDLDGPIRDISARLAMAARRNRPDLVVACKDQLQLIVLEKQLALGVSGEGGMDTLINVGVNALINGAIGALASKR